MAQLPIDNYWSYFIYYTEPFRKETHQSPYIQTGYYHCFVSIVASSLRISRLLPLPVQFHLSRVSRNGEHSAGHSSSHRPSV